MKYFIFLIPTIVFAASIPLTPFPVFLKAGFTSVLEFEEAPTKVVVGDSQSFQIEKLNRSLAIRTLASEATSNMFVYFKSLEPKLFILNASDEAQPTFYKKFESIVIPKPQVQPARGLRTRIVNSRFDTKKDYFTVEAVVVSHTQRLTPLWDGAHLIFEGNRFQPAKIWSERKDVQKDSHVKARFIFYRPNIPKDLKKVSLVLPVENATAIEFKFGGR